MDRQRLDEIARTHGIEVIVQFGSSVTGQMHAASDIDLAVLYLRAPDSLAGHGALVADLQALVPDRDVDVAILNHADPLFLKQVMDHARPLYGPRQRFEQLKLYAFKRYQDHRPYLAMERAYVARAITSHGR